MGRLGGLLLCAVAAWCCPAAAFACKCAPPPPVAEALLAANAVFEGQVTKLTPSGEHDLIVELNVVRSFKGANTEQIRVQTPAESAACGYPFERGQSYLVYADPAEAANGLPALRVHHCGRTNLLSDAEADLRELGMGVVPVTPSSDDLPPGTAPDAGAKSPGAIAKQQGKPAAGGCASCSSMHAPVTRTELSLGLLLLAASTVRLRRRTAHKLSP